MHSDSNVISVKSIFKTKQVNFILTVPKAFTFLLGATNEPRRMILLTRSFDSAPSKNNKTTFYFKDPICEFLYRTIHKEIDINKTISYVIRCFGLNIFLSPDIGWIIVPLKKYIK